MTRIALIGAGSMGANHARVVSDSPAVLAAIVDVDQRRAVNLAERYGCHAVSSIDLMPDVDGVIIATPADRHTEIAARFIERGIPVLVEKPVAVTVAEVQDLVELARRSGTPFLPGFVERFNPVVQTARVLLREYGSPTHIVGLRHSPPSPRVTTGVVHDLLIHDIDLALSLLGSQAVVRVNGAVWVPGGGTVEEIADATVVVAGGSVATLSASRASQRKVRELRVAAEDALLELDLLRRTMTVYRHVGHGAGVDGIGYSAETVMDIPFVRQEGEPLALQFRQFLGLVSGAIDPDPIRRSIVGPHLVADRILETVAPLAA